MSVVPRRSKIDMLGRTARLGVSGAMAATIGLMSPVDAREGLSTEVALSCRAEGTLSAVTTEQICDEFLSVLEQANPGRKFRDTGEALPRIELTVTHANERGMGLQVLWVHLGGGRTEGTALKTAFYDRGSDATTRRIFMTAFLQQNPMPF